MAYTSIGAHLVWQASQFPPMLALVSSGCAPRRGPSRTNSDTCSQPQPATVNQPHPNRAISTQRRVRVGVLYMYCETTRCPCSRGPIGAVWLARQPDLMRSAAPASSSTSRAVLRSSPTCSWLRSCAYLRAGRAGGRHVGRGPPCKICRRYSIQG